MKKSILLIIAIIAISFSTADAGYYSDYLSGSSGTSDTSDDVNFSGSKVVTLTARSTGDGCAEGYWHSSSYPTWFSASGGSSYGVTNYMTMVMCELYVPAGSGNTASITLSW